MLHLYTKFSSLRRQRIGWGWIVFLCVFALLGMSTLAVQTKTFSQDLYQFLKDEMGFSRRELQRVKEGKVVTKKVDSEVKHEVAICGISRFNIPQEFFIQNYEKKGLNIEMAKAEVGGIFSHPPEINDVKALTMPSVDLRELKKCKIGDCNIKAPAETIEAFRQLDESASDFQTQANALFRRTVVKYVQDYLSGGNAAMIEYRDKKNAIRIAEEFHDLLEQSPYLDVYMPALRKYLEDFPKSELPNTKSGFYWIVENFGENVKRPILSVHHMVFYQPESRGEIIVASKQLYANHYYEGALGLTIIVDDPESNEPGFYLMHINRSRIDVLRGVPRFLAGDLFKGALDLLDEKMKIVKRNVEKLYQIH